MVTKAHADYNYIANENKSAYISNCIVIIAFYTFAVDSLLSRSVDPCCTDTKKRSPLHMAAAKGNERMGKN